MGEKIKEKIVDKERRKPILDAARTGKADLIDKAIQNLVAEEIAHIRGLCKREWGTLIPDANRTLLLEKLTAAERRIQTSTHDAVATTSGVITPQAPAAPAEPEKVDTAALIKRLTEENAALRSSLGKKPDATKPATPAAPAARPTTTARPSQPAPAPQGPSRGTRTTPVAPPRSTHVAEGIRR